MLTCKGYSYLAGGEYQEYDCSYPHSGDIDCDSCIINGGRMSPQTGKPFRGNQEKYEKAARRRAEEAPRKADTLREFFNLRGYNS